MGAWGTESCSNDSCWDNLSAKDIYKMTQKEVNDTIKKLYLPDKHRGYKGKEADDFDKLGVVVWCLSQGKRVDIKVLEEVLEIAKKESDIKFIRRQGWRSSKDRKISIDKEVELIKNAIKNGGKGKKPYIDGLFHKFMTYICSENNEDKFRK